MDEIQKQLNSAEWVDFKYYNEELKTVADVQAEIEKVKELNAEYRYKDHHGRKVDSSNIIDQRLKLLALLREVRVKEETPETPKQSVPKKKTEQKEK